MLERKHIYLNFKISNNKIVVPLRILFSEFDNSTPPQKNFKDKHVLKYSTSNDYNNGKNIQILTGHKKTPPKKHPTYFLIG